MEQSFDEPFLKEVTEPRGGAITGRDAIFAENGLALPANGNLVRTEHFERLLKHKLRQPSGQNQAIGNGVTNEALEKYARALIENDPGSFFEMLRTKQGSCIRLLRALRAMTLLEPMAFKLTLARDQLPELFDHSIRVTLLALYLGIQSHFSDRDLATLAAAGMFHDLGLLYIDPTLMAPGRRLGKLERHHLYSHPITAYVILRDYPAYHPEVSVTVLEHHERLDGSGYPRGLSGMSINMGSQILMLAEVAGGLLAGGRKLQSAARLTIMLKLNQHKFNRVLSNHLIALAATIETGDVMLEDAFMATFQIESQLKLLSHAFLEWNSTYLACIDKVSPYEAPQLVVLLNERIDSLRRNLLGAGLDLDAASGTVAMFAGDNAILAELGSMLREAIWQFCDILHEMRRRWHELERSEFWLQHEMRQWLKRTEGLFKIGAE